MQSWFGGRVFWHVHTEVPVCPHRRAAEEFSHLGTSPPSNTTAGDVVDGGGAVTQSLTGSDAADPTFGLGECREACESKCSGDRRWDATLCEEARRESEELSRMVVREEFAVVVVSCTAGAHGFAWSGATHRFKEPFCCERGGL